LNSMGHEPKETLATTMSGHERLQALTYSYKRGLLLPWSLMGSRMGFWKRSKLGFVPIFKSCLLQWIVQDYRPFGFGADSSYFRSSWFCLSPEGLTNLSLVFLNFFALWFLFPSLKLKLIEMGWSRHASSNFLTLNYCQLGSLSTTHRMSGDHSATPSKVLPIHGDFCFTITPNPKKQRQVTNHLLCK
jgi:hypothetical protein